MNQTCKVLSLPKIFFSISLVLVTQQASATSTIISENSFGSGDYYLTDYNTDFITGGSADKFGVGVDFYGSEFALNGGASNSSSGVAAGEGSSTFDVYSNEHYFSGNSGAYAKVADPYSQLSIIQVDGESVIEFTFKITVPHTYTLTGSMLASGTGRSSIFFDSASISDAGSPFSLNGTLAAGTYTFTAESIASLSAVGTSSASFDFALQLNDVSAVPVPAAVWLFGSGLIGLAGLARRKKV